MDRVLSARVDEAVIKRIGALAKQLGTTKKAIIERAILAFAEKVEAELETDLLVLTSGAWTRGEPVEESVERARRAFRDGMERHQK